MLQPQDRIGLSIRDAVFAERQARADIGCLHGALVDAEAQDQADLDDEGEAEEEREPAHRGLAAALLERLVIEAVDDDLKEFRKVLDVAMRSPSNPDLQRQWPVLAT